MNVFDAQRLIESTQTRRWVIGITLALIALVLTHAVRAVISGYPDKNAYVFLTVSSPIMAVGSMILAYEAFGTDGQPRIWLKGLTGLLLVWAAAVVILGTTTGESGSFGVAVFPLAAAVIVWYRFTQSSDAPSAHRLVGVIVLVATVVPIPILFVLIPFFYGLGEIPLINLTIPTATLAAIMPAVIGSTLVFAPHRLVPVSAPDDPSDTWARAGIVGALAGVIGVALGMNSLANPFQASVIYWSLVPVAIGLYIAAPCNRSFVAVRVGLVICALGVLLSLAAVTNWDGLGYAAVHDPEMGEITSIRTSTMGFVAWDQPWEFIATALPPVTFGLLLVVRGLGRLPKG